MGYKRCRICKRKSTGSLVFRGFDFGRMKPYYFRNGVPLCQPCLEEATEANLAREVLGLEDLILAAARRA